MRLIISIVLVAALIFCFGCAKKESALVEQPEGPAEAQVDTEPIAEEGFESGEVGDTMTVSDGEDAEADADVPKEGEEPSGH